MRLGHFHDCFHVLYSEVVIHIYTVRMYILLCLIPCYLYILANFCSYAYTELWSEFDGRIHSKIGGPHIYTTMCKRDSKGEAAV